MRFNKAKCRVLALGSQQSHATLQAWGGVARERPVEKDLGVLVDSRLNMS